MSPFSGELSELMQTVFLEKGAAGTVGKEQSGRHSSGASLNWPLSFIGSSCILASGRERHSQVPEAKGTRKLHEEA